MSNPILPSSRTNPIGQTALIRKARSVVNRHIARCQKMLLGKLGDIPTKSYRNNIETNATRYEYQISASALQAIIDEFLALTGQMPSQYVVNRAIDAYRSGTAVSVTNLIGLTSDYTRSITGVLVSEPYRRRVALLGSRVFEEMEGFAGEMGKDLATTLRRGMENGQNPLVVARDLRARFDVSKTRAERIARTEITGAHRRARLDESDDVRDRLGIRTKMLWLSALKSSTRHTHSIRHGNLYTPQEVRDFYSVDGNAINCLCAQTETLVDDSGNPLNPQIVERVKSYAKPV
jgi:SPP1 gp7 family putative phage head morphogenesis protein